jgi:hypothetical protein
MSSYCVAHHDKASRWWMMISWQRPLLHERGLRMFALDALRSPKHGPSKSMRAKTDAWLPRHIHARVGESFKTSATHHPFKIKGSTSCRRACASIRSNARKAEPVSSNPNGCIHGKAVQIGREGSLMLSSVPATPEPSSLTRRLKEALGDGGIYRDLPAGIIFPIGGGKARVPAGPPARPWSCPRHRAANARWRGPIA